MSPWPPPLISILESITSSGVLKHSLYILTHGTAYPSLGERLPSSLSNLARNHHFSCYQDPWMAPTVLAVFWHHVYQGLWGSSTVTKCIGVHIVYVSVTSVYAATMKFVPFLQTPDAHLPLTHSTCNAASLSAKKKPTCKQNALAATAWD
jgi:hypothetical protein